MKALSLCKLTGKQNREAALQGLSYSGGILLSFAVLALLLIGLKGAGAQIGWGFQLQNPAVILFLVYLLFTIGLNLAGFFEFGSGLSNIGGGLASAKSHRGSFFTGILAALVATPCTAPFMGVAMGYALTQPAMVSLSVFLALGLGLALPYLLITLIPPLRTALPRPGAWMEIFRQFLAFPMFASAIWLIWVYTQQAGAQGVLSALSGCAAIAFLLWLRRVMPAGGAGRAVTFFLMLLSAIVILTTFGTAIHTSPPAPVAVNEKSSVVSYSAERLASLKEGDKPLFVNMTAAWCITCKVNERVALDTEKTRQLFDELGIVYIKGDWTNYDAEITEYLMEFDRNGVPIYVYYGPRDIESGKRPDPVVLPQILTPGIIAKTLTGE